MCDPVSGAITLSSVAGWTSVGAAASSVISQQQQASYANSVNATQYQNSVAAQAENSNQINLARVQQAESAGQKINANNMAMRESLGTTVASGGPSGLSMDALLGTMASKGATYNQSVTANLDRVNSAIDNQLVNVNRNSANEINSLRSPAIPDYFGSALKIANTYETYDRTSGQAPKVG